MYCWRTMIKHVVTLALTTLAIVSTKAEQLTWVKAIESTSIPSDGVYHELDYVNKTGVTMYIRRVKAYVQGQYGGGDLNGYVDINDGAEICYWTWHLLPTDNPYGIGATGNQVPENLEGTDYFVLQPGGEMELYAKSSGFGGRHTLAGVHFWYTTVQP